MGNILIVEDNEVISDHLRHIIVTVDPSRTIHSTGYAELALAYTREHEVDVFLLDIELLDYSGIHLAEKIREIDRYKMTPIVFITGNHSMELEAYRNTQCYKFISKPFQAEEVTETLRIVITHPLFTPPVAEKLVLRQKGFVISIFQKDILYIEARRRRLLAITVHEELELSSYTLGGILGELTAAFFQCHKGYIVNQDWIFRVDKNDQRIHLRNNRGSIPYGDKYKEQLTGEWL